MAYVLGISGLGTNERYMRSRFPGLSERTYRLAQGADSAAALVSDSGIEAAAAEERFTRRKGTGEFPREAVEYVLAEAKITMADVAVVAHGFDYSPYKEIFESSGQIEEYSHVYSPKAFQSQLYEAFPKKKWSSGLKITAVSHHSAHAASALHCSGYEEADVLVADGIGEFESTSLFAASGNKFTIKAQNRGLHSIGLVYGLVTMHLGFWMNMDEYKVMGLAPYGNPNRLADQFEEIVQMGPNGQYLTPLTYLNQSHLERATYSASLQYLESLLGPARKPDEPLSEHHLNIAAALQATTERAIIRFLSAGQDKATSDSLCFAGGVALNCVLNQAIRESGLYKRQYVQPAAGDDGTALGAALFAHRELQSNGLGQTPMVGSRAVPYFGPSYDSAAVESALARCGMAREPKAMKDLASEAAELLATGHVLGLFQGRMEYGPRALGHRSILADPRKVEMRDRINSLVKQREEFRPLAPAVLEEHAKDCFSIDDPKDFLWMIETVQVRSAWRVQLGAVTHVDGSARIQVVREVDNPLFWLIIHSFYEVTGVPVLLNTSFNSRGEPIVCTPLDAVAAYEKLDLDGLVMDKFLIRRQRR